MEICLVSLIEDVGCTNLRYLSSYIRNNGHTTKLVFLPRLFSEGWPENESYKYPYSRAVLRQIEEISRDSDLVGLSLMTCHLDNAIHVTNYLKQTGKTVIWGGVHPTINPQECLNYADMVCVGEGECKTVELLDRLEEGHLPEDVQVNGILTRKRRQLTAGQVIHDLDELGFPDFDMDHQYMLYEGSVVQLDKDNFSTYLNHCYRTLLSRGCAYACTYCCNNVFKQLDDGKVKKIRWRSIDDQIEELKYASTLVSNLSQIDFSDDTFLARPYEKIEEFAARYKEEVGVGFRILSSPLSITYEKIKVLADAGLVLIGMGVQSAYEPVRKIYKRRESLEQIKKASEVIRRVSDETGKRITVRYDFIIDNPWGGEKDVEASIRFAMTLDKPLALSIFSLVFYPGTELYRKAKEEGLISDELNEIYRVTQLLPKPTYMNNVFMLLGQGCPKWIVKIFLRRNMGMKSARLAQFLCRYVIKYPATIRFFLFERFRNNRRVIFIRTAKKIAKRLGSKKVARSIPRFEGRPGEINWAPDMARQDEWKLGRG